MSIDPRAYYEDTYFEDEIANIFSRRLFVGTIADFPEIDSFRTIQLGREPITIRKTHEGIKAFSNVCLHRSALIDPPGAGTRPFRCPYHAWSYDSHGVLTHAPKVDLGCLERTHLRTWQVQVIDGLVFIGDSDLDLSKISNALQHLSINYSTPFYKSHIDHDCNWKLLVENVLEGYHISSVHPKTFVPTGITSNSQYHWSHDEYVNYGTLIAVQSNTRNARLASIIPGTRLQYGHIHIFPNVFISNGNDHIGYIGYFIPTGPNQTRLEWCLFEQALLRKQNETLRESLRNAAIEFTRTTLLEDKAIVESCQTGLRSSSAKYQMQNADNLEARVINFQSYYRRFMPHV